MTKIYNKKHLKEKRRYLRKNMPYAEAILWSKLNRKQINGERFLRQFSIKNYVVDFFCPRLKLAIEVDGNTHFSDEDIANARKRQKDIEDIEDIEISFLRFTNIDVYKSIESVIAIITNNVIQLRIAFQT